jgi:hypothetical protein
MTQGGSIETLNQEDDTPYGEFSTKNLVQFLDEQNATLKLRSRH